MNYTRHLKWKTKLAALAVVLMASLLLVHFIGYGVKASEAALRLTGWIEEAESRLDRPERAAVGYSPIAAVAPAMMSMATSGCATPSFGAAANFGAGNRPYSVAVGDFNLDGKPDLAVANALSANVSVLLGNGAGGFGAKTDFGAGTAPNSVAVGDFNLDGKPDLAVANYSSNNVSVLLGNGAGGFGAKTDFGAGTLPYSVAVGDFNLDGKPDLAVANYGSNNVSVLLGNGAGGFGAKTDFGAGTAPASVAVGDFNQDGKPDLAVANFNSNNVSVLPGNGAGSFGAKTDFGAGTAPTSVAVGDFNQDGKPDLAVANANSNNVSVLLNTCNGTPCAGVNFGAKTDFGAGTWPFSVAVGDFNLDGKPDLAVANASSNNVSVLLGNGAGGFGAKTDFGMVTLPTSVAVGDFNLDGKPDLAVASDGSPNVFVLLGNGAGGFGAQTAFGVGSRPFSVAVGDLNLDGKPDLAVANASSNNVSVLLGNGAGGFGAKTDFGAGLNPYSVAVGDFNLDGKPDLAVANLNSANVSVLLGNGAGGFGAKTDFGAGIGPRSVAVGDFNLDGKPDLAVANEDFNNVSVLLGNGAGGFGPKTDFGAGSRPLSVAVGDFNLDGKPDLAVANFGSANVSVLLGNGAGSFGPKTDFGVGTLPRSVAVGDFNLDGKPDLAVANRDSANVSVLLNTCTANTPPTINAVAVSRTAGAGSSNSPIATVNDAQDALNTLSVKINGLTVTGMTTVTVNGVTISNVTVDVVGVVKADVVAACGATNASFTLRVTDSGGLFNETMLTVTALPDSQPPMITCPTNITVGTTVAGTTVTYPAPTASDNCAVETIVCDPPPGSIFLIGTKTVTCTATDTAGNPAMCSFNVTVNRVAMSFADPLTCRGPGDVVTGTITITNNGTVNTNAAATAALPAGLVLVPASCSTNIGTCNLTLPSTVTYNGTLTPGQTATITYQAQIGDVPSGTQLCATTVVNFDGGPPLTVQPCLTVNCPALGVGSLYPSTSAVSDQKAGSVLIYPVYTSDAANASSQNARLNITNTHPSRSANVHLFFVDGSSCSVADSYICLTANQTASVLASDIDPGTTGYLIAIASDRAGCPINFNYLIGDEFVKFSTGHAANLGAEAVAAIAGGLPACNADTATTATLNFDGVSYNPLPRVLASSNLQSRADGNDTMLIVNRIGGSLLSGAATINGLFGLLYDDAEKGVSFQIAATRCQLRTTLTNDFRTTPRYESIITNGRTGWMRLWSTIDVPIIGAQINRNPNAASNAGAFNQGHNLHKLTLTNTGSVTIPIFPPLC